MYMCLGNYVRHAILLRQQQSECLSTSLASCYAVAKGPLGTVTAEANGALDNDCWVEVHSRTFTAPLSCMHTQSRLLVCIGTSHVHTGSALADDWL